MEPQPLIALSRAGATAQTPETSRSLLAVIGVHLTASYHFNHVEAPGVTHRDIGSASVLKVMTNYLAAVNLVSICEAMTTIKAAGLDLATTYEAIRISSGTSFAHETEGQVILNGSRDISFTMDLANKDTGLFQSLAEAQYGSRELPPNIIRRLEDATGLDIRAPGFPAEITDREPGYEVIVRRV